MENEISIDLHISILQDVSRAGAYSRIIFTFNIRTNKIRTRVKIISIVSFLNIVNYIIIAFNSFCYIQYTNIYQF